VDKRKRQRRQYERTARRVTKYGRPYKGPHVQLQCEVSGVVRRETPHYPSRGIDVSQGQTIEEQSTQHEYGEEMFQREQKARKEAERRKKMIAPLYNKGAYQYIGDVAEEVVRDLGRKK